MLRQPTSGVLKCIIQYMISYSLQCLIETHIENKTEKGTKRSPWGAPQGTLCTKSIGGQSKEQNVSTGMQKRTCTVHTKSKFCMSTFTPKRTLENKLATDSGNEFEGLNLRLIIGVCKGFPSWHVQWH